MNETVKKLALKENALKVLSARYLAKDEEGNLKETPSELFRRVARCVAESDLNYNKSEDEVSLLTDRFYSLMTELDFLPNSPTLMNAGRPLGQLSACFVLPVEDSMESIFDAVKNAAIIHKSGGGTGFSFSRLRPSGDVVGSTKGVSSGPVSFMTVFDTATEAVKQGGTRRGANMGMLRVDHPDIVDFIRCKQQTEKLNNFNISVAITDDFMRAVEQNSTYNLRNPRTAEVMGTESARDVFDLIVDNAWNNGEPGIVFIDRINKENPTPHIGRIESTNPCGEQPLLPYESCNLGSINLAMMVAGSGKAAVVDWKKLRDTTWAAVHFLDNVIDANMYPLDAIGEMTRANRKIGLGVMGWADMLIELGIPYNSAEAVRVAEEVMGFIQREGIDASEALAAERGVFPNYSGSIYENKCQMRNATVTTIAPTGTLSILAGCSSGIEPLFAVSYVRNVMDGTKLVEVNPLFEKIARERGFWSDDLMERIAQKGSIAHFEEIPDDVKRLFVTAHDITPVEHISMQAAFQRYVDNAVSKTVNFSNDAIRKDVEEVYLMAYRMGCKGVTVYRDGSRDEQVLSTGKKSDKLPVSDINEKPETVSPRKRPSAITGSTRLMLTGCGNLYVTVNQDDEGNVFELFTQIGKAGGCASSQSEALGRMISLALRSNIEKEEITKQLKGISCHQPMWSASGRVLSCADAIAKALELHTMSAVWDSVPGDKSKPKPKSNGNGSKDGTIESNHHIVGACVECGGAVEHEGGCAVCHNCGYTKCG